MEYWTQQQPIEQSFNWSILIVILILLGIFIIFIIILSSGYNYYKEYSDETCKAYLSSLNGQLMRSLSNVTDPDEKTNLTNIYNQFISASKCSSTYKLDV